MGPAHGGVEFLKGSLGFEGLIFFFLMKKSLSEKICINIKSIGPDFRFVRFEV